jgi:2-polyprenyl-3-methyl-5-hydroxy-6-metoxy-1,4-benzoquinol methylase
MKKVLKALKNNLHKISNSSSHKQKGISRIEIPGEFNRNHGLIMEIGPEKTASTLINLVCDNLNLSGLSNMDVLDIGCGVRFTQAIINCGIPIKSYTGVDVHKGLIDYLSTNVLDSRLSYYHWNIHNELYNKDGIKLSKETALPCEKKKKFDLIWLFSVFTHLNPMDSEILLYILRQYINENGYLFFSAFIDNEIDSFDDRVKENPLLEAYYNETIMKDMLSRTKWQVQSVHEKNPEKYIQHHFICTPLN